MRIVGGCPEKKWPLPAVRCSISDSRSKADRKKWEVIAIAQAVVGLKPRVGKVGVEGDVLHIRRIRATGFFDPYG